MEMGTTFNAVSRHSNHGERHCKNYNADAKQKKTPGEIAVSKETGGILSLAFSKYTQLETKWKAEIRRDTRMPQTQLTEPQGNLKTWKDERS